MFKTSKPLRNIYKSSLFQIIVVSTVIRCIIARFIDLGNDEVYYFTYAVQPDLNHFDHPPLVGLFIRLFTLNLNFNSEIFMRMPGIVGAAVNTWLIARCGLLIRNQKTGILAAILYNTSVYNSIISGVFILPDSVQLVFWLAALYAMLKSIDSGPTAVTRTILLVGLWTGLAIMSKVHGIFLWAGFFGFILFNRPTWLKNPYLYISIFITAAIISPIVFWNIDNQFITWQFHSERVVVENHGVDSKSFLITSIGQILYSNPFQFVLYLLALVAIVRDTSLMKRSYISLLLWCSLPIILATTVISLFRETLPHWSGPGFIGITLVSAAYLEKRFYALNRTSHLLNAAVILIFFVFVAGLSLVNFYPGTLGEKQAPKTGRGDATLDIYGWHELLPAFKKIRENDIRNGSMSAEAPMVVHQWFPGAHMYYYVAYPLGMRLVGVGNLIDLHKFSWLNTMYGPIRPGSDAYYISPSNNFTDPSLRYGNAFQRYEKAGTITQKRNNKIARFWYVYRLRHAQNHAI